MEAILDTKSETILEFIRGLRGSSYATFEEGTWAVVARSALAPRHPSAGLQRRSCGCHIRTEQLSEILQFRSGLILVTC
jgi:hypothetical protein